MSTYKPTSAVSLIMPRARGRPHADSATLFDVMTTAKENSAFTDGAFESLASVGYV